MQSAGCLRESCWLRFCAAMCLVLLLVLVPQLTPLMVAGAVPKSHLHPISPPPPPPPPPPSISGPSSLKSHHSTHLLQNFTCSNLAQILQRKNVLLHGLGRRIDNHLQQQPAAAAAAAAAAATPTREEKLKLEILKIYQNELKATESSLLMILRDLNQTLGSDYRSLTQVKQSCRLRLDDMRSASVKVEEDYNTILELEKEMNSLHPDSNLTHNKIIAELLSEVSHAADSLEGKLNSADIFQDSRHQEGAALETVVKLQEGALPEHHNLAFTNVKIPEEKERGGGGGGGGKMAVLIDSGSNLYVLSRPRDVTIPIEDHQFIHNVVNLLLLSFALGILCSLVKVPSLLGYILAGLLLGPFGYNTITSVVQIETLGEFGVLLTVLCVALDFTPEKLRKVWGVAVIGGNILLLGGMLLAVVIGISIGVRVRVGLAVVACLSLSSAPLAHRFIDGTTSHYYPKTKSSLNLTTESNQRSTASPLCDDTAEVTSHMNGLLVMQDIQLGTLVALMPVLADSPTTAGQWKITTVFYGFLQLLQTFCGFCLLVIIARQLTTRLLEKFYRLLGSLGNRPESVLLGSVAVCFLLLLLADYLGASMELGCFLAGLAIGSQGHSIVEQVKRVVEPLRDFLSLFFFASLGFHIFPTFLLSEFSMILGATFCILVIKFLLSLSLLGVFSGHCHTSTWLLSLSLSPVSEYSFLLASRARRLGIISREVYLVVLSISSLSLLFTPLVWRLYTVGVSVNCFNLLRLPTFKQFTSSHSYSFIAFS